MNFESVLLFIPNRTRMNLEVQAKSIQMDLRHLFQTVLLEIHGTELLQKKEHLWEILRQMFLL